MAKDNYFSGDRCGNFMWGKGLDAPKDKRSKVWHDTEKPRFAEGGSIMDDERRNNREEMDRIKGRASMERRDLRDEEARIHRRAESERDGYKKGGPVKHGMFNNPKLDKGGLHKSLGIPMGKDIGIGKIDKATHSKSPLIRKQAVLAENMMGRGKKK